MLPARVISGAWPGVSRVEGYLAPRETFWPTLNSFTFSGSYFASFALFDSVVEGLALETWLGFSESVIWS